MAANPYIGDSVLDLVKDFHAAPDLSADAHPALNRLVTAATTVYASGGALSRAWAPGGQFELNSTTTWPNNTQGLNFTGNGPIYSDFFIGGVALPQNQTLFEWNGSAGGTMFSMTGVLGHCWSNMSLSGQKTSVGNRAGVLFGCYNVSPFSTGSGQMRFEAMTLWHATVGFDFAAGFTDNNCSDITFEHLQWQDIDIAIRLNCPQCVNYVFNKPNTTFGGALVCAFYGGHVYVTDGNSSGSGAINPNSCAAFTGSISATTLTLSGATGTIAIGQVVTGLGVAANTVITAGSGLSWTVSISQTVSSTPMNSVAPKVIFTGSISTTAGGTLTVTGTPVGTLLPGMTIEGAGVVPGTMIMSNGTGSGGAGTYLVNVSQTVGSESMTGGFWTYTFANLGPNDNAVDVRGHRFEAGGQTAGTVGMANIWGSNGRVRFSSFDEAPATVSLRRRQINIAGVFASLRDSRLVTNDPGHTYPFAYIQPGGGAQVGGFFGERIAFYGASTFDLLAWFGYDANEVPVLKLSDSTYGTLNTPLRALNLCSHPQYGVVTHTVTTTTAAQSDLTLDGLGLAPSNVCPVPQDSIMLVDALITAVQGTVGAITAVATFHRQFAVQNANGTTSLIGSMQTIGTDNNTPAWTGVATSIDAFYHGFALKVQTGAAITAVWNSAMRCVIAPVSGE